MEDTHLNEVKSLISSNEARVNDLEAEVQKQEAIIESKTEEIDRLQREIHQFKQHSSSKDAHYEKVVKELKEEQVRLHLSQNE
jgi:peptidoglycan hydrolase CwlO-like protein